MMISNYIIEMLVIALVSTAWVALCMAGEIFDFVPAIVQKITLNPKINKVIYQCEKCVAGQIMFWYFIVNNYKVGFFNFEYKLLVVLTMSQIAITIVIGSFVFKMKNQNGR